MGERWALLGGSLLLRSVQPEDTGVYMCIANSTAGSVSQEVRVRVFPELNAHIVPASLQIIWLKDGQRVIRGEEPHEDAPHREDEATVATPGARLVIHSVQREDQGMYQCVASSEGENVQATAELRLGGE
ncbi:Down syndrome cell adhesion molecule-like protein Dscam2 [Blattella germanica]|nr:Down syndrome cell adhesion molecule-like protein Dscam2 [Blattella germanica]